MCISTYQKHTDPCFILAWFVHFPVHLLHVFITCEKTVFFYSKYMSIKFKQVKTNI